MRCREQQAEGRAAPQALCPQASASRWAGGRSQMADGEGREGRWWPPQWSPSPSRLRRRHHHRPRDARSGGTTARRLEGASQVLTRWARPVGVERNRQVYSKRARQRSFREAQSLRQNCSSAISESRAAGPFRRRDLRFSTALVRSSPSAVAEPLGCIHRRRRELREAHLRSRRAAEAAIASSGQMARCFTARSESVVSHPFGTR